MTEKYALILCNFQIVNGEFSHMSYLKRVETDDINKYLQEEGIGEASLIAVIKGWPSVFQIDRDYVPGRKEQWNIRTDLGDPTDKVYKLHSADLITKE